MSFYICLYMCVYVLESQGLCPGLLWMQGLSRADGLPDPLNTLSYFLGPLHSWNSCREMAAYRHETLLPFSQASPGLYLRGMCLELASRLAEVRVGQCHTLMSPQGWKDAFLLSCCPFPSLGTKSWPQACCAAAV